MPTITIDRTSQRFTSGAQPKPAVVVEHTTEVMGWPGYSGGGEAPHATIWPLPGVGIKVREHIPWTQNAKALMNLPGGVETNRRGVIQFELIGTCDPSKRGKPGWYFWPDADDVVLQALADYQRPIMAQFGIPFVAPAFQAYSASYGPRGGTNTVRMSNAQWNAFRGICGHQHVPENVHGDPGAFPIAKFLGFLKGATTGEDDVSAKEVADYPLGKNPADDKTPVTLGYSLEIARNYSYRAYIELVAMRSQVAALVSAVAALSKGEPLDQQKLLESIQAATRQGILDAGAALNAAQEVAK